MANFKENQRRYTILPLSPGAYDLLAGAPGGEPDPNYTLAVAAFDEQHDLVGRFFLVAMPHLEAPWIREDHRGGTLFWRMEKKLLEAASSFGINRIFAFAANDKMANYLRRGGYKKSDLTVWEKNNARTV